MFLLNTEYWTAKAWLKTRRKEIPDYPLLGNGDSVNLSFYLNHCYTHISKQILEYIFLLNKCMLHGILGCSLDKSVDYSNFAALNNIASFFIQILNLIFYYYYSGNNIHDLLVYCCKYWPKETIPPNLYMLKDHAADFIERSSPDHGV